MATIDVRITLEPPALVLALDTVRKLQARRDRWRARAEAAERKLSEAPPWADSAIVSELCGWFGNVARSELVGKLDALRQTRHELIRLRCVAERERDEARAERDALLSDRVAAQGVRDLLDGKLTGAPLPGTLADRVADAMIDLASKTLVAHVWQR